MSPVGDGKCHNLLAHRPRWRHRAGTIVKPRGAQQSVRLAIWVVQAVSVGLALVELGRFATTGDRRLVVIGAVAVGISMPLHLQHLRYGLRGLRPPRSEITFGVMLVVHAVALVLIGPIWGFMLATLATSGLVVLRPRWAGLLL